MGKILTKNRIKELFKNPYVLTLVKEHIIFTEDFRKKVVLELFSGKDIYKIFEECGFITTDISKAGIRGNKRNWTSDFKIITKEDGNYDAVRIKGAYPELFDGDKVRFITVKGGSKANVFTKKQIEEFKNNKYVDYIDSLKINFTPEFKRKFIEERNRGKGSYEIFNEAGFPPNVIGEVRLKSMTRRWRKQSVYNPTFAKGIYYKNPEEKCKGISKINKLEKRIEQLEIENEFLKKVSALRKG